MRSVGLIVSAALVLAAPTFSASQAPPIKRLPDKPGDPEDGNYKRYPTRRDLDIRLVEVTKYPASLRLVVQTAATVKRGNIYSFYYYHGPGGNRGGLIQVRYRPDGTLTTDANIEPSANVLQLPSGAARIQSNRLVLTVPNRYLDPARRFRWRVATSHSITDILEVRDDAPDQGDGVLDVRLAKYP